MLEVNHGTGRTCFQSSVKIAGTVAQTLKFQDHLSTHFLFRYAGQRVRFLRSQFDGLKIHSGTLLFLPPCWFVSASPLVYSDLNASLLDCPAWLLDSGGRTRAPER